MITIFAYALHAFSLHARLPSPPLPFRTNWTSLVSTVIPIFHKHGEYQLGGGAAARARGSPAPSASTTPRARAPRPANGSKVTMHIPKVGRHVPTQTAPRQPRGRTGGSGACLVVGHLAPRPRIARLREERGRERGSECTVGTRVVATVGRGGGARRGVLSVSPHNLGRARLSAPARFGGGAAVRGAGAAWSCASRKAGSSLAPSRLPQLNTRSETLRLGAV